jgi:hypothetical protein
MKLPDVRLTRENTKDAIVHLVYDLPKCCRMLPNNDPQIIDSIIKCQRPAKVKIQLKSGQYYNLCESHAIELGIKY